ncbi:protein phosphatase 1 regulatory subunit 7-like [Montipora foliosa]|uniref:protein phosphatase 1 regulatory subunit 7-like n=1 Tax=Montipora foliosa TaxID=591990 RepID=UPI0035F19EA9
MLSATRSQKQAIQDTNKIQPGKSASTTLRQTRKRTAEEKRVQSSPAERETENKLSVQEILDRCKESDHGRVFEINLNGQALKQVPNLKEFQKLKILDLGCNKLKELSPNDLEKNCDLRELKLYANEITEISGLDRCKELNNLLLQHNKIKLIGKGLQNVRKLKVLRLDNNRLSKIDYREIGCCSQLTVLDISCNDIHDISALNALPTLEELDLSNNKISRIPDMGRCKKIQELDISRNHISNLAGLRAISTLTVLRAENNDITSLDSIGKLRCLQELYLAGNRISEVKSFPNQFSALEILDLSNNIIENIEEMFVLSGISTLVELSVKGNPFKSEDGYSCHRQISQRIPSLEFLDKVSLKRPNTGHSHAPPPMRPMSASQVLSSRQVEEQIKATLLEQESFEASISSRFNIVRDLFKSLPMELRINQSDERSLSKISVFDVESVSASRPSSAGEESRPKSRCSSRSRIAEARAFAAEHFRTQEADTNSTS